MRGYLYIVAAAVLWGIIGPFSRLAFSEGLGPMEVAFWRASLAWLFFGTHAVLTKRFRIAVKDLPMVVIFALAGITLFYSVYQLAIRTGGAAMASVLLYTAPAWVVVIARFTFEEMLTPIKLTALVLTLSGVVCVASGGGSIAVSGMAVFYGLASGFSYSLYFIFGKYFSSRYSSPNLFFYLLPSVRQLCFPGSSSAPKAPLPGRRLFVLPFCPPTAAISSTTKASSILKPPRRRSPPPSNPWWPRWWLSSGGMNRSDCLDMLAVPPYSPPSS